MNIDASFEHIQEIVAHPNADALEVAVISNYPCVVRKGEFKKGELVFYVRDDAKLIEFDRQKEAKAKGEAVEFAYPWQESLLKYLGGNGRVKTIKLRGKMSMGILLKPDVVCESQACSFFVGEDNVAEVNAKIKDEQTGPAYLEKNFGVTHWYPPATNVGPMNVAHSGLEDGVKKSDEDNWEQIDDADLHLGSIGLVTRKLDGSSTTVICRADGTYAICSRTQTFKPEADPDKMNTYQKLTQEALKAGLWYAKEHNKTIAIRGESCADCFNKFGVNKDWQRNAFYVYGIEFPDEQNFWLKYGTYGTDAHFLKVVAEMNAAGYKLETVPVLGEKDITKEMLKSYNDAPASDGEGVVINVKQPDLAKVPDSVIWHFKSKSREYLAKIH